MSSGVTSFRSTTSQRAWHTAGRGRATPQTRATNPAKTAATTVFCTSHQSMSVISNDDNGKSHCSLLTRCRTPRKSRRETLSIKCSPLLFLFLRSLELVQQSAKLLDFIIGKMLILHQSE